MAFSDVADRGAFDARVARNQEPGGCGDPGVRAGDLAAGAPLDGRMARAIRASRTTPRPAGSGAPPARAWDRQSDPRRALPSARRTEARRLPRDRQARERSSV